MADLEELYNVFESFCHFGSTRNINGMGSMTNVKGPMMEGAKFAKFCRDCHILDSKIITTTEVDITFNKVKAISERKIDFDQFVQAVKLLSAKKYAKKTPNEAFVTLCQFILRTESEPLVDSALKNHISMDVTNRLTNPNHYPASHKARFEIGQQLRESVTGSIQDLSSTRNSVTNQRNTGSINDLSKVAANKPVAKRGHQSVTTASAEQIDKQLSQPKKHGLSTSNSHLPKVNSGSKSNLTTSKNNLSNSKNNLSGSVFDRLTDSSGYTGSHKHRFDGQGNGRGMDGRDAIAKGSGTKGVYRGGNVNSLSQILRT
jgi:hypothetical protein